MSYIKRETPYVQDLPILFNQDGAQYPRSVVVSGTDIASDAKGYKIVPAGSFVVQTGNVTRFLARSLVTSPFSVSTMVGTVALPYNTFKTGDSLYIVEPYGSVVLSGTFLSTETVKVTIDGYSVLVVTGSTINTVIAATVANTINNDPNISGLVKAVAMGAIVYLYGKDGSTARTLTSAARNADDTGASVAGVSTASGSTLTISNTVIGIIAFVSVTGVITLTANSGLDVPVGARIGVRFTNLLGVYCHGIDFMAKPSVDIAPCFGCDTGIYTVNLPYVDEDIKRRLNRFVFY